MFRVEWKLMSECLERLVTWVCARKKVKGTTVLVSNWFEFLMIEFIVFRLKTFYCHFEFQLNSEII